MFFIAKTALEKQEQASARDSKEKQQGERPSLRRLYEMAGTHR
jgi:hypothetical protein